METPLVLLVEDDIGTRALYRDYLGASGFRIADAHNGYQALDKARTLGPDVVFTDLAVPGMDGFEFCRALRQGAGTRHIPILAVTGHPEYLVDHERIRHAGISQVLSKPCDLDAVVRALRQLVRATNEE